MKIKRAIFFQNSNSEYEIPPPPLVGKSESLWRRLELRGSLADHNKQHPLLPMLERVPKLKESLV